MTNENTPLSLVYRNDADVELHAAGCAHMNRRDFKAYVNVITPVESLKAAALDYADAVDYGDNNWHQNEDGSWAPDVEAATAEFIDYIKVLPCAAKIIKESN